MKRFKYFIQFFIALLFASIAFPSLKAQGLQDRALADPINPCSDKSTWRPDKGGE